MDKYIIGCDAHKNYSQFSVLDLATRVREHYRVAHEPGAIADFLSAFPKGTPVALESVGNWYWIVDEIESAGCIPLMAHAAKAKVMMGNVNKTDKLDADGLVTLVQTGTLPTVWLPPAEVRDARELPRTRMSFAKDRTKTKNQIHSDLAKYGLKPGEDLDIFTQRGRAWLEAAVQQLPPETRQCVKQKIETLDHLEKQIAIMEGRIRDRIQVTPEMRLLKTLPGVGDILAVVMALEIGDVERFADAENLVGYSGTAPKAKNSGRATRSGGSRSECNHYLKWAFHEAANVVARQRSHPSWRRKDVVCLYEKVRKRRGHGVAIGAVARQLTEAAYWVLKKTEPYVDPNIRKGLSKQRQARCEAGS